MAARSFDTRIDIAPATRAEMTNLLNARLADAVDLYTQAKQAHWNVKGPEFVQLHELFDSLAGDVLGYVDLIAERATALGGEALGTARMAAGASYLR
jgi:starvation-inducible DNA-binding protein